MLIAQLSDPHVRPRGQRYREVADSNLHLARAIEHLLTLDRRPDLVLLTGDLVDEGHLDEYAMLLELLGTLPIPYLVIPGNHDSRENFRAVFSATQPLPAHGPLHYCVDAHALRIVALDSCVPGDHYGALDAAGLQWLRATLEQNCHQPTLLLIHHPPFVSGIPYLDDYRYRDEAPLAAVVQSFGNIEAVLCGHVHRQMSRRWAGTIVLSCPSTTTEIALQLKPDARPQSFVGPPACLLHWWQPGQGLVSHLSIIGERDGPYPFF